MLGQPVRGEGGLSAHTLRPALRCAGSRKQAGGQKNQHVEQEAVPAVGRACTHRERACDRAALCGLSASASAAEVKRAGLVPRPQPCIRNHTDSTRALLHREGWRTSGSGGHGCHVCAQ